MVLETQFHRAAQMVVLPVICAGKLWEGKYTPNAPTSSNSSGIPSRPDNGSLKMNFDNLPQTLNCLRHKFTVGIICDLKLIYKSKDQLKSCISRKLRVFASCYQS